MSSGFIGSASDLPIQIGFIDIILQAQRERERERESFCSERMAWWTTVDHSAMQNVI